MGAPQAQSRNVIGLALKGGAAIAVSALAMWWAFRGVDVGAIVTRLKSTNLAVLAVFVAANLVIQVVRTVRWGLLVRPLGPISARALYSASFVGIPASIFLPLRLGELVRPAMIARAGAPFAGAMASVVVERVADGLLTVGLFFLLLAGLPASAPVPDEVRSLSWIALVGFGGACIFLIAAVFARGPALGLIDRIVRPISPRIATKVRGLLASFLDGLKPLAEPRRMLAFAVLTAIYWGINGWATWLLMGSYGLDLPFLAGPFTICVVVFAIMIPAGPAFAGTMEVGFRLGLATFGVPAASSALVAVASHITQLALMAVIAGIGLLLAEPGQRGPAPPDLAQSPAG